ncbi:unnamed protein product [Soboliphyme baturini]|uniref:Ovule protein n=1 Tax=Soboliphyme baturini TaxID=241478 RepID=A0A183IA91_9BILA|nr:unnamed protein product [Soboliphyme baturini]
MPESKPLIYESSSHDDSKTIVGAQCNVSSLFNDDELREHYFGCQNVPTSVWFRFVKAKQNFSRPAMIRAKRHQEVPK